MKKLFFIISALSIVSCKSFSQWTVISSFPNVVCKDIITADDTIYTATSGSGVYISYNAGLNWVQSNSGLSNTQARSVNQLLLNGNNLYAATVDGIYKSTNRGANWVKKSTGIIVGGGASYALAESIFGLNGKLFTGAYTGIYSSTNGAENWQVSNIFGSAVLAKNFTLHNGILFAARESINTPYAYNSTNNGLTWNTFNSINIPTITFFSEPPLLWSGTTDGVLLSTNNGVSWQVRNNGLHSDPYSSCIIRVSGTLLTSLKFSGSDVYRSSNNGMNWEEINQGLPFLNSIEKLIVYNGKVIAATSGGLWQRNISEIVVGIEENNSHLPQSYRLFQNYPNPFNPETKIRFQTSESGAVRLTIFDILGRKIITLVNKHLSPGDYDVVWDASSYSSGIYYYMLETNGYSEIKKMILLN